MRGALFLILRLIGAGSRERLWNGPGRNAIISSGSGGLMHGAGEMPDLPCPVADEIVAENDRCYARWDRVPVRLRAPDRDAVPVFTGIFPGDNRIQHRCRRD